MKQLWEWSFLIGPVLLYGAGVIIKHLGSPSRRMGWEHVFFSQEIAISNAGSVLSAFVVTAKSLDAEGRPDGGKMLVLIALAVAAVFTMLVVTQLHRAFDEHPSNGENRTMACVVMLGFVANLLAMVALSATLYFTTGLQPPPPHQGGANENRKQI